MIIKFVVDNHDFVRESQKALLLKVGCNEFVWIPNSLIEPCCLALQSKLIIPDDMQFYLWKGDITHLWIIDRPDRLKKCSKITTNELKMKYYSFVDITI